MTSSFLCRSTAVVTLVFFFSVTPVLLHCAIAWRASHLWAAHLIRDRNVPVATALSQARQINLMDDMRMSEQQPLEKFLGHVVPEMGQPKQ